MVVREFMSRIACFKVQCQHSASVKSFLPASSSLTCRNISRFRGTLSLKNLRGLTKKTFQNHIHTFGYKLNILFRTREKVIKNKNWKSDKCHKHHKPQKSTIFFFLGNCLSHFYNTFFPYICFVTSLFAGLSM